jgi:hypothetical protein
VSGNQAISHISAKLRSTSPRAAALDALLDSVTRRRMVDRLDLAALEVSGNPLQTLPSSIHIQQGLGFVKDPIIFGGLPHGGSLPTAGENDQGRG